MNKMRVVIPVIRKEFHLDFKSFVDSFFSPTIILSVKKTVDGGYGEIRIVAANGKYVQIINDRISPATYVPDALYTDYFPQNQSFEDVCFKSAIQKKEVHTYAHINKNDIWFDIYAMPIDYEEDDVCYCTYSATLSNSYSILDTFNTSQTASEVLKTCIKLHQANNLKEAMEGVISATSARLKAVLSFL